jgi:hypothetical protein
MSDYEEFRDAYLTGKILHIGEMTKVGEILRRGTNYVTVLTEKNGYKKVWLKTLQEYMIESVLNDK